MSVMEGGVGEREAAGEAEGGGGGGAGAGAGGTCARSGAVASLQQQQRRVIRWERFLPRRSLRVLLVEQDDSTRHIVTALLRKCSYHGRGFLCGLAYLDPLGLVIWL